MIIRQENRKDYDEVYKVIKQAFLSAEHSDGTEQDLVVSLRKSVSFIPELSLVAVENDKMRWVLQRDLEVMDLNKVTIFCVKLLPKMIIKKEESVQPLSSKGTELRKLSDMIIPLCLEVQGFMVRRGMFRRVHTA